jgi:hypothetical protein
MATITITMSISDAAAILHADAFRGIGKIERKGGAIKDGIWNIALHIPRMSPTRFENVVKRVLTKNLTEQGITPLSIEYSE